MSNIAAVMGGGPYQWADRRAALARLRSAQSGGERLRGKVVNANRGGILIRIDDVIGFLPRSQLKPRHARRHRSLVGRPWRGYVLRATSRKLILTPYSPAARRRAARRQERFLTRLSPGRELRGKVRSVTDYGAFVRLGRGGVEGLVVRDELSWWRVSHPADVVREGERVRVRVLGVRRGRGGRSPLVLLSVRRTQANPWTAIAAELHPGATVRCRVEALGAKGAWLRLTDHPRVQSCLPAGESAPIGSVVWARVKRVSSEEGRLYLDGLVEPLSRRDEPRAKR